MISPWITLAVSFGVFFLVTWIARKVGWGPSPKNEDQVLGAALISAFIIPWLLGGSAGILTAVFLPIVFQ